MRTLSTAQTDALAQADRSTFSRIKVEDPDGTMVDVSTLGPLGESLDFLDGVEMDANADQPIATLTVTLFREVGGYSIAPLVQGSLINRDSAGSYAAFLNPNRSITWEVATLTSASPGPASADWVKIFDGYIDVVDWGGRGSKVILRCRDGLARMNDTFIETTASYGDDGGTEDVEDVMQEILTAYISAPAVTLASTPTSFAVREYELGNVTVLEAMNALRDLIGWNVSWKWNTTASDFRPTLWEPARTNTTADYTFGTDDYFLIPNVALDLAGIRNKGEVVYITTSGTVTSATETRTSSVTLYSTRFVRIDARGTSVVTSTQAANLLDAVLDDLEEPSVQQQIELPFFWPVELGDLYAFSPNQHYDTEQKWGVFGFRHMVQGNRKRTILSVSGKPSGGYARWHNVERVTTQRKAKPEVAMTVAQSGTTGSLDLTISDPDFAVTNVQFAEKTDAGAYGALATTWDRSTGTIGLDTSLTRGEDITLAAKHAVSVRYVVTYDDGHTSGLKVEGAHSFDADLIAEITGCTITRDASGNAVVAVQGDEDCANIYITVGDGTTPSDPTSGTNDGSVSGRNGTISTSKKITTGNEAIVKVIGYDSGPTAGPVRTFRQDFRQGPFDYDTSTRSVTGTTSETTLDTITIPANKLGANGGIRITARLSGTGGAGNATIRLKFGGTTILTRVSTTTGGVNDIYHWLLFNDGATNSQVHTTLLVSSSTTSPGGTTSAIDTTSSADVVITGQLGDGADTLNLVLSLVEFLGTT